MNVQNAERLRGRMSKHAGLEDPTRLVIVEIWESVRAHQASVKNIPPGNFAEIMKMLAKRPKDAYFSG